MAQPALVLYPAEADYLEHYKRVYCRQPVRTADDIRVYFSVSNFGHAFYECSARDGQKDLFSPARAQRIDWIKATLQHPEAVHFEGWNRARRAHESSSRVAVLYEDFVVVVRLSLLRDESLKGNFITCYKADNSIDKIRRSPTWTRQECIRVLRGEGGWSLIRYAGSATETSIGSKPIGRELKQHDT